VRIKNLCSPLKFHPATGCSAMLETGLHKFSRCRPVTGIVLSMSVTNNAFSSRGSKSNDESISSMSTFYNRDPTVPFWRANVDADQLFEAFAHRPERAQAWLRYRDVSESCFGFQRAVMMRGKFELGILGSHMYHWSFTPTHTGDLAVVLPVYEDCRMVDLLAMSRHDPHNVWGCTTAAGLHIGSGTRERTSPVRVYKSPINWLLANCDGILPLAKGFFPSLQSAPSIIAEDAEHAWKISELAFMAPAVRLGFDCEAAEQAAFDRIGFDEVAA